MFLRVIKVFSVSYEQARRAFISEGETPTSSAQSAKWRARNSSQWGSKSPSEMSLRRMAESRKGRQQSCRATRPRILFEIRGLIDRFRELQGIPGIYSSVPGFSCTMQCLTPGMDSSMASCTFSAISWAFARVCCPSTEISTSI